MLRNMCTFEWIASGILLDDIQILSFFRNRFLGFFHDSDWLLSHVALTDYYPARNRIARVWHTCLALAMKYYSELEKFHMSHSKWCKKYILGIKSIISSKKAAKTFRNIEQFIDIGECTKTISLLKTLMLRYLQKIQRICGEFLRICWAISSTFCAVIELSSSSKHMASHLWCKNTRNDS